MQQAGSSGSEAEVTWADQQNINKFGRLNNRLHELDDEIKAAKVIDVLAKQSEPDGAAVGAVVGGFTLPEEVVLVVIAIVIKKETNESLEDASNELILTDEDIVRFQIGEVFAHVPKEEVESRIEEMTEATTKNLEKLEEEKASIVAQMAELKRILYAKFKDSINLEED